MNCPECGGDHHAPGPLIAELEAAAAEDHAEAAELEAVAEGERTERNADDNDTAEAIAEVQAGAAVEIARVEAAAAVEIVEAEAAAAVEIAQAEADALVLSDELDDDAGALVDELDDAGGDLEPAAVTVTSVEVPPQVETEADRPARAAARTPAVSAFRRRRMGR